MFDNLVQTFMEYPYLGVGIVFLLCGLGLPLPEEIVLIAAGYVCYELEGQGGPSVPLMMLSCGGAILLGDVIPYAAGRAFGPRLLRIRWLRFFVTKSRLAMFDRWFRKRGDMVILIARFLAGIRMVAFFTAGAMKMPWNRFLLLDGLGIAFLVPLLVYGGYHFGPYINDFIEKVKTLERGILITVAVAAVGAGLWWWLRARKRRSARVGTRTETYVEPSVITPSTGADDAAKPLNRVPQGDWADDARPGAGDGGPPREPAPPVQGDAPGNSPNPSDASKAPDSPASSPVEPPPKPPLAQPAQLPSPEAESTQSGPSQP